jgi:carbon starvation protein CstA
MRAYLSVTATLFVLLTVAHVLRAVQEPHLARDPWFILTSILAVALAVWAGRLLRTVPR